MDEKLTGKGTEEEGRSAALRDYRILDTDTEAQFDLIVRQAARSFDTPIALVSLIDENRQWFKAKVGLEMRETPRSMSFCTHAIRNEAVMVVEDARLDDRFADNPLVTGDPNIRFYAGAPLKTSCGRRIGTLCVIDRLARPDLTPAQKDELEQLAERTMTLFEQRRRRKPETGATAMDAPPRARARISA
jgi:GAF domain-containing protein